MYPKTRFRVHIKIALCACSHVGARGGAHSARENGCKPLNYRPLQYNPTVIASRYYCTAKFYVMFAAHSHIIPSLIISLISATISSILRVSPPSLAANTRCNITYSVWQLFSDNMSHSSRERLSRMVWHATCILGSRCTVLYAWILRRNIASSRRFLCSLGN